MRLRSTGPSRSASFQPGEQGQRPMDKDWARRRAILDGNPIQQARAEIGLRRATDSSEPSSSRLQGRRRDSGSVGRRPKTSHGLMSPVSGSTGVHRSSKANSQTSSLPPRLLTLVGGELRPPHGLIKIDLEGIFGAHCSVRNIDPTRLPGPIAWGKCSMGRLFLTVAFQTRIEDGSRKPGIVTLFQSSQNDQTWHIYNPQHFQPHVTAHTDVPETFRLGVSKISAESKEAEPFLLGLQSLVARGNINDYTLYRRSATPNTSQTSQVRFAPRSSFFISDSDSDSPDLATQAPSPAISSDGSCASDVASNQHDGCSSDDELRWSEDDPDFPLPKTWSQSQRDARSFLDTRHSSSGNDDYSSNDEGRFLSARDMQRSTLNKPHPPTTRPVPIPYAEPASLRGRSPGARY